MSQKSSDAAKTYFVEHWRKQTRDPRRNVKSYEELIQAVNAVGIKNLRAYCLQKPKPLHNFDRDMQIIKDRLKGFDMPYIHRQYHVTICISDLIKRYTRYAKECAEWLKEQEENNDNLSD